MRRNRGRRRRDADRPSPSPRSQTSSRTPRRSGRSGRGSGRRRRPEPEPEPEPVIIEEPSDDDEEEPQEIAIPRVWRLADQGKAEAILKLVRAAEAKHKEEERRQANLDSDDDSDDGAVDTDRDDDDSGLDDSDSDDYGSDDSEDSADDYDTDDDSPEARRARRRRRRRRRRRKQRKAKVEKPFTLLQLSTTRHPITALSLLQWTSIVARHFALTRKLLSFGRMFFCFSKPELLSLVDSWVIEMERMHQLKLGKLRDAIEEEREDEGGNYSDDDDDDSDYSDDDDGDKLPRKGDVFKRLAEEAEGEVSETRIREVCSCGIFEAAVSVNIPQEEEEEERADEEPDKKPTRMEFPHRHAEFAQALYPNGDVYIGPFVHNRKTGSGIYVYGPSAKSYYIGSFQSDSRNSSLAFMKYPNGDIYQGAFVNDERVGHGRMIYADSGDYYDGTWASDVKCGYGTYVFAGDGSVYKGLWANGVFVRGLWRMKSGTVFRGGFSGGKPSGIGIFYFPKIGTKQLGEFQRGGNWVVEENMDMTQEDFDQLDLKFPGGTRLVILTGFPERGRRTILAELKERVSRNGLPNVSFIRSVLARPRFGSLHQDFISSTDDWQDPSASHHAQAISWKELGVEGGILSSDLNDALAVGGGNASAKTVVVFVPFVGLSSQNPDPIALMLGNKPKPENLQVVVACVTVSRPALEDRVQRLRGGMVSSERMAEWVEGEAEMLWRQRLEELVGVDTVIEVKNDDEGVSSAVDQMYRLVVEQ